MPFSCGLPSCLYRPASQTPSCAPESGCSEPTNVTHWPPSDLPSTTTHAAPAPPFRSVPSLPQHSVEPHRGDDDYPDHHLLDGGRHVEHHQSVEQHTHDQGANDGVGDFAAAAKQRRASDHGRRDGLQLEPLA